MSVGITTRKIMVVPCMVKIWSKASGERNVLFGTRKLNANEQRLNAAHDKKDERRQQIKNADALVIHRGNPTVKSTGCGCAAAGVSTAMEAEAVSLI